MKKRHKERSHTAKAKNHKTNARKNTRKTGTGGPAGMADTDKEMKVARIEHGTVIDHIPPENTFSVLRILKLGNESVTVGNNLKSSKMAKKGIVKIADKELSEEERSKIALLAKNATVCTIRNFKVLKKSAVEVPERFVNVIRCINPSCITRNQDIATKFNVIEKSPLRVKCHYCETLIEEKELTIL